jgi:hypothetical protein
MNVNAELHLERRTRHPELSRASTSRVEQISLCSC